MTEKEEKELDVDIAEAMGAVGGVSAQCFFVYVPDKDRDGNEIGNQRKWVLEALQMAPKLTTKSTVGRIQNTSKTVPRLDPAKVAKALGAEPSEGMTLGGLGGGPLSLYHVRQELFRRLQSTGGRPSLSGTSGRKKIPLNDKQWTELEEIASEVASPGFSPSAGQIASVLLTLSLRSVRNGEDVEQEQNDTA